MNTSSLFVMGDIFIVPFRGDQSTVRPRNEELHDCIG